MSSRRHIHFLRKGSVMDAIRKLSDKSKMVSDEFWPLPKYREMLFLA